MHRVVTAFIFNLILHASLAAQLAPDFSITDSWGESHQLYADYLDQGKTVVVKIFYVACPPCNMIAPHLEPLYQAWGGGHADVEFFELSIQATDTDAKINTYKASHQTTFPATGGQGGSVPATLPYRDGSFGIYPGTPTFVVIAPDKTVTYDVVGAGIEGTVEALDAAIAATGATGVVTSGEEVLPASPASLVSSPVHDALTIRFHRPVGQVDISLHRINGQRVHRLSLDDLTADHIRLDVSDLEPGIWLCTVRLPEAGRLQTLRFVKS